MSGKGTVFRLPRLGNHREESPFGLQLSNFAWSSVKLNLEKFHLVLRGWELLAESELFRDRMCRTLNQVRNLLRVRNVD
jgi:hypothetical protein